MHIVAQGMNTARLVPTFALCLGLGRSVLAADSSVDQVVDRVVVVVEGQVITQSELEFEARVFLVGHGALGASDGTLDTPALRSALELAINQRLQEREAEKLKAFPVEPGEIESAMASFRARFSTMGEYQAFLSRNEADELQLVTVLSRGLRAEKMLDSKLKLRAQISESDVRAYYDQHSGELSGTYAELRQALREKLFREKYTRMAAAEVTQLRQKADIRSVAPFARQAAGQRSEP
jgi:hypothetical protein